MERNSPWSARPRATALVLLLIAAMAGRDAHASYTEWIVANHECCSTLERRIQSYWNHPADLGGGGLLAQQFRTDAYAYSLDHVTAIWGGSGPLDGLGAAVYADVAGTPGTILSRFQINGTTFLPTSPVFLQPETNYWFGLSLVPADVGRPSVTTVSWRYLNSTANIGPGALPASLKRNPAGTTNWTDSAFELGVAGSRQGIVPELDPGASLGAFMLTFGGLLILFDARTRSRRLPPRP